MPGERERLTPAWRMGSIGVVNSASQWFRRFGFDPRFSLMVGSFSQFRVNVLISKMNPPNSPRFGWAGLGSIRDFLSWWVRFRNSVSRY
jgi:hypothetical protein